MDVSLDLKPHLYDHDKKKAFRCVAGFVDLADLRSALALNAT